MPFDVDKSPQPEEPKIETEKPKKVAPPQPPQAEADKATPKRGRPKGGKPKPKHPAAPHWTAEQFAEQFQGLHQLAAVLAKDENLAVSSEQSLIMGTALEATFAQYDLWWLLQGGALLQLAAAAAIVEGPIILYLVNKKRAARGSRKGTETVVAPASHQAEPASPLS
jgi:hypothetical protein